MHPKAEVALYHNVIGEISLAKLRNKDSLPDYKVPTAAARASVNPSVRSSATSHTFRNHSSAKVPPLLLLVNKITGLDPANQKLRENFYTAGGYFGAHSVRFFSFP